MFDPQTQLKRLGRQWNARLEQHLVGISSAVADRQDYGPRRDVAARRPNAPDLTVDYLQTLQSAAKAVLASQRFDVPPKVATNERQAVASQMGPVFIHD